MTTRTTCRATKYLVAAPTRNDGSNGATDRLDQIAHRTNGPFLEPLAPGGPEVGLTALGDHQCCAPGNSGLCRRIELIIIGALGFGGGFIQNPPGQDRQARQLLVVTVGE